MNKKLIAQTAQTEQHLRDQQASKADAKRAMAQVTALRENEDVAEKEYEEYSDWGEVHSKNLGFEMKTGRMRQQS